jgi:hypothetical protein
MQGFGKLLLQPDGDLLVTDVIIPPQEVTSGAVQTTGEHLHKLWIAMSELDPPQFAADWPLWWHSHAKMGVFASGEDKTTLEAFATEFGGLAIGLVTNAKEEFYGWYSTEIRHDLLGGKPFHHSEELKVYYEHDTSPSIKKQIESMMEGVKVKEYAPVQSPLAGMHIRHGSIRRNGASGPLTGWHNGVHGKWIEGEFVPDDPDMPPMNRRQRKKLRRQEAQQALINELEEDSLWTSGWYAWLKAQYPADSEQAKMSDEEFAEWIQDVDNPELLPTVLDGA